VRFVGRNDSEVREAKVGHGAGGRADVERIARRDKDYFELIALGFGQQGIILERCCNHASH
jgi:hypothetical protein